MHLLADENIPGLQAWFGDLASALTTEPGRAFSPSALAQAEVLLVRSVTQVNANLLAQAPRLQFVGSTTIGFDHLDQAALAARQIPVAWAPGCNAPGVVDYVLAALLAVLDQSPQRLVDLQVAVIGAGAVGGQVVARLRALGCSVWVCDPPRQAAGENDPHFVSLEQALQADILCCHTPITTTGPWPTAQLLSAQALSQLPSDAIVLNAGRGGVISTADLRDTLRQRPDIRWILDVWDPEPELPLDVCAHARIATGHIAGYSLEGRLRGTQMVRTALSQACQLPASPVTLASQLPSVSRLSLDGAQLDPWQVLQQAVLKICDPWGDDLRFRQAFSAVSAAERGQAFDAYRRHYVQQRSARRELSSVPVATAHLPALAGDLLAAAGFQCQ
jgi:erythronate-4-phosphate dehydrogenase